METPSPEASLLPPDDADWVEVAAGSSDEAGVGVGVGVGEAVVVCFSGRPAMRKGDES